MKIITRSTYIENSEAKTVDFPRDYIRTFILEHPHATREELEEAGKKYKEMYENYYLNNIEDVFISLKDVVIDNVFRPQTINEHINCGLNGLRCKQIVESFDIRWFDDRSGCEITIYAFPPATASIRETTFALRYDNEHNIYIQREL